MTQRLRKVVLAATAMAGLLLAVAGLTPAATAVESLPGRLLLDLPVWLGLPFLVLMVLGALFIVILLASGLQQRPMKLERPRSALAPGLMLFLVAVLWMGASDHLGDIGDLARTLVEGPGPGAPPDAAEAEPAPPVPAPLASGILATLLLVLAVVGFGVVAWLYFMILPSPGGDAPPRAASAALQAAVEDSLDDLRHLPDARLAIIRCYDRFERALAVADVLRAPWQTALEFMTAALKHPHLPRDAVRDLTRLFEIARFSRHELGPEHRERAWQALVGVKAALEKEDVHGSKS